jgi:NO-binding membrane sensor protein with MHYT domain
VVAILASYTALHLASRVSVSRGKFASWAWLVGGALSMGIGIWSMHFLGMLGASIGKPIAYGLWWTLASLATAVSASGVGLFLVRKEKPSELSLGFGGIVMGAGITSMHYMGMLAIEIIPAIEYEPALVAASLLIAVLASWMALKLFVALRSSDITHPLIKRGLSAIVMGVAIAGMHYTGMASAQFAPGSICTAGTGAISTILLAEVIVVFTLLTLAIALITSLYDAHLTKRAWQHNQQLMRVNEQLRIESEKLERANSHIRHQSERLVGISSDLEVRVLRSTQQLDLTIQELEAFSQAVAHDLRGPLSSIGGFCGLLRKPSAGSLNNTGLHYLDRINASTRSLAELIEALLSLTRLSSADLKYEHVDLSGLAADAFEHCRTQHPERTVSLSVAPGMSCMGDRQLLRRVLDELIENAWKFSADRFDAAIDVGTMAQPDGQPIWFVRDNGVGFDMAHADKLFGSFQHLHSPSAFKGAGIGLATARRIVLRHQGRIWAESTSMKGATFFFTLWDRV